jgi:GTPase
VDDVGRDEAKNLTVVMATVVVDKESHRRIVIGSGGRALRDSGAAARMELESTFGGRFFLDLTVAARPGWREDARFVATLTS